jgi:hypothetical protein
MMLFALLPRDKKMPENRECLHGLISEVRTEVSRGQSKSLLK